MESESKLFTVFMAVATDLPHFTFLGVAEAELSALGLKQVTNSGRTFWVQNIGEWFTV